MNKMAFFNSLKDQLSISTSLRDFTAIINNSMHFIMFLFSILYKNLIKGVGKMTVHTCPVGVQLSFLNYVYKNISLNFIYSEVKTLFSNTQTLLLHFF